MLGYVLLPTCELDYSPVTIQPGAIHMYPVRRLQGKISIPHGRYRAHEHSLMQNWCTVYLHNPVTCLLTCDADGKSSKRQQELWLILHLG